MKKKKILILTDWYEPGFKAGGPIQSCRNFVLAMFSEYDIAVLTSDRDLGEEQSYRGVQTNQWISRAPGIHVYYADLQLLTSSVIEKLISEQQPDFIYLNSMYSYKFSVIPFWLSWRKKIPAQIVLSPRGMLQEGALQFKTAKKKLFITLLNRMGIPKKIRFHATDEQEKKDILRYFPSALSVEEISNFPAPLPEFVQPVEKVPGSLKTIYISRIIPKKNILFFLRLLNKLPAGLALQFDIYGEPEDGAYWEQAMQVIKNLPVHIKVNAHGSIPHEKVTDVLNASHLFVLPSRGENFGHAIFESWSVGRPCLISDKTPWHDLQKQRIGWDLSMHNDQPWIAALTEAGGWNQEVFKNWSGNSRVFAEKHVGKVNLKQAYFKLFS